MRLHAGQTGLVVTLCLLTAGCFAPHRTRWPTLMPNNPLAENKSYESQDPFPDPDLGPKTFARPRGYVEPRAEPRRAAEQRLLHGLRNDPAGISPQPYPSGQRYSNTVR